MLRTRQRSGLDCAPHADQHADEVAADSIGAGEQLLVGVVITLMERRGPRRTIDVCLHLMCT